MPPISYKTPRFDERNLSTNWETVLLTNCSSLSSPSLQIPSKTTDLRIFSRQDLRKENSFVTGSEEGTAMVDSQSQTKRRQVTFDPKISNVNNIRCFIKRMGTFSLGHKKGGPWSNLEAREHISVLEYLNTLIILKQMKTKFQHFQNDLQSSRNSRY